MFWIVCMCERVTFGPVQIVLECCKAAIQVHANRSRNTNREMRTPKEFGRPLIGLVPEHQRRDLLHRCKHIALCKHAEIKYAVIEMSIRSYIDEIAMTPGIRYNHLPGLALPEQPSSTPTAHVPYLNREW